MSTVGRSSELQAIDKMNDSDWKIANQISYRIGISNGLADVIYRLIKAEKKIALLEEDLISARTALYERILKLEVKNQNQENDHESTDRKRHDQARGQRAI
jgi:hypothetical protein